MTRVGKRSRRVAAAEAVLVDRRRTLREDVRRLAGDARDAATPGRIVAGGLILGALTGLLQPARSRSREAAAKPAGSTLDSINRLLRMLSMALPLLGMIRGGQPAAGTAGQMDAVAGGADAGGDGGPGP